jgi:hypothetical protein
MEKEMHRILGDTARRHVTAQSDRAMRRLARDLAWTLGQLSG